MIFFHQLHPEWNLDSFRRKLIFLSHAWADYPAWKGVIMYDECIFNCEVCGTSKTVEVATDNPPECCDKPMKKKEALPVCETTATAEHSRMDKIEEPCDDGRSGEGRTGNSQ